MVLLVISYPMLLMWCHYNVTEWYGNNHLVSNHNKPQQRPNHVHISWHALYIDKMDISP